MQREMHVHMRMCSSATLCVCVCVCVCASVCLCVCVCVCLCLGKFCLNTVPHFVFSEWSEQSCIVSYFSFVVFFNYEVDRQSRDHC